MSSIKHLGLSFAGFSSANPLMPISIRCFSFVLDSCNLVKLPLEQYSVLNLFTDTAGNGTEKADKKSQLNVLEEE